MQLAALAVAIIGASPEQRFYSSSYVYTAGLVVAAYLNPDFFVGVELRNAVNAIRDA